MAINLSNLSDVLTSKVASSNSSTSQAELDRQSSLSTKLSNFADAVTYTANTAFPAASVSNAGQIVYDSGADKYYFSTGSDWQSMAYYFPPRSTYGYVAGGWLPGYTSQIDRFPFATDENSTDVGDLTQARSRCEGCSSSTYGYVAGGQSPSSVNTIDKFQFGSESTSSDVGDLSAANYWQMGAQSSENGYWAGGNAASGVNIEKISFASEGNASDIGSLTTFQEGGGGASSSTHGYIAGAGNSSAWPPTDVIEKYPFATDSNASSVGGLAVNAAQASGSFSETYGYVAGGVNGPPAYTKLDNIQKYPFAADSDSTDIANLTLGRYFSSGSSSINYGYNMGGNNTGGDVIIEKYSYATDSDATDVGDLSVGRLYNGAGNNQY